MRRRRTAACAAWTSSVFPILASFARMGYPFFREVTVQMLPDSCSNKIGFSVQVRRILQGIEDLSLKSSRMQGNKSHTPPVLRLKWRGINPFSLNKIMVFVIWYFIEYYILWFNIFISVNFEPERIFFFSIGILFPIVFVIIKRKTIIFFTPIYIMIIIYISHLIKTILSNINHNVEINFNIFIIGINDLLIYFIFVMIIILMPSFLTFISFYLCKIIKKG
ncbi:MAG: hypothetical protein LBQ46_03730 [Treponema sp.]|jgi:hypothetical protein|nr:hypothetical protein [Treponema sp.]